MKRISIHSLYKERHNMQKEKPFFLFDEETKPTSVALAIKINERFYNSDWFPENVKDWKKHLMKAMQQIAIIQKTGWAKTGEVEDEWGYTMQEFRCAYCDTVQIEPKKECICRGPLPKFAGLIGSGFVLPQ